MENQYSRRNFFRRAGGLIAAVSTLSLLSGCEHTVEEYSDVLHEDARVIQPIYIPSQHGSGSTISFHSDGEGNLNPGLGVTSIDINEKYGVVFECKHGNFVVEGEGDKYKKLWKRMRKDETVDITYKEVYQIRYTTENGQRKVLEKRLKDYWFIDAQPKGKIQAEKSN